MADKKTEDNIRGDDGKFTRRHEEKHSNDTRDKARHHIMNMNYEDPLYVNPKSIPYGYEYYWVRESCMDKPDNFRQIEMERKGWVPVPANRHPELVFKGMAGRSAHNESYISHKGLVLYERQKELCDLEREQIQKMVDERESGMKAVQGGGPGDLRNALKKGREPLINSSHFG